MKDTQRIRVWKEDGMWWWKCGFCFPPCIGHRLRWDLIFNKSLPKHFKNYKQHHAHVNRMLKGL